MNSQAPFSVPGSGSTLAFPPPRRETTVSPPRRPAAGSWASAALRGQPLSRRQPSPSPPPHANPGRRSHTTAARRTGRDAVSGAAELRARSNGPHSPRRRLSGHRHRVPFDVHLQLLRRRRHDTGTADLARRGGSAVPGTGHARSGARARCPSVKLRPQQRPGRRRRDGAGVGGARRGS